MTAPAGSRRQQFGPIVVEFDDQVLSPRPWTLMQSEWAADLARSAPPGPMLELCAGAGHIGLAAAVLADGDLVQVEQNPVAAAFAERNAAAAGHAHRTTVRVGAMQHVVADDERFPIVIADPPYLPTHQVGDWPQDPVRAIDGGPDGLELVRVCLRVSAAHLAPGGHLLLQLAGAGQVAQVRRERAPGLAVHRVRAFDSRRAVMHLTKVPRS